MRKVGFYVPLIKRFERNVLLHLIGEICLDFLNYSINDSPLIGLNNRPAAQNLSEVGQNRFADYQSGLRSITICLVSRDNQTIDRTGERWSVDMMLI